MIDTAKNTSLLVMFVSLITLCIGACNVGRNDGVLLQQGEQAMRDGRLEQAIALLERAASADSKNIVCWKTLAAAYERQGDADGAEKVKVIIAELGH